MARTALEMHSGDKLQVLVGGLELGYTAREALLSGRVARVEVVELLPQVIDWLASGLVPRSSELQEEMGKRRRLIVTEGDVYRRLADPPGDRDLDRRRPLAGRTSGRTEMINDTFGTLQFSERSHIHDVMLRKSMKYIRIFWPAVLYVCTFFTYYLLVRDFYSGGMRFLELQIPCFIACMFVMPGVALVQLVYGIYSLVKTRNCHYWLHICSSLATAILLTAFFSALEHGLYATV